MTSYGRYSAGPLPTRTVQRTGFFAFTARVRQSESAAALSSTSRAASPSARHCAGLVTCISRAPADQPSIRSTCAARRSGQCQFPGTERSTARDDRAQNDAEHERAGGSTADPTPLRPRGERRRGHCAQLACRLSLRANSLRPGLMIGGAYLRSSRHDLRRDSLRRERHRRSFVERQDSATERLDPIVDLRKVGRIVARMQFLLAGCEPVDRCRLAGKRALQALERRLRPVGRGG